MKSFWGKLSAMDAEGAILPAPGMNHHSDAHLKLEIKI